MSFSTRPAARKKVDMYDSEIGTETLNALIALESSPNYITKGGHTLNRERYPDGEIPFTDLHMLYLHQHPLVNPMHYMSNLRLKLRIR
jgi:hypothetical protein